MKSKAGNNILLTLLLAALCWGCSKDLFRTDYKDFTVKSFISNIKCFDNNASFQDDMIPYDTSSVIAPVVSVQSWVVKGKDVLMSITVPVDATQIYFAATNPEAEYAGLEFDNPELHATLGYYQLSLTNKIKADTISPELVNYMVVLSSNEDIQLDNFDLLVSCNSSSGYSDKAAVPIEVISIAPYQKELILGFKPIEGYSYTITIGIPGGGQIVYSSNTTTGNATFDNSQSIVSSMAYDFGLDVIWIHLDPQFGRYTMNATINIDLNQGSQYIYVYFFVITEGKIDQLSLDADIIQTGEYSALGIVDFGFSYFEEYSEIIVEYVKTIISSPQNIPLENPGFPPPSYFARVIEVFEGMTSMNFQPNKPSYLIPDKHLQLYHKDVCILQPNNSFQYKNIKISLNASLKIPPDFDFSQLNEVWRVIAKPLNASNINIENLSLGNAVVDLSPIGGIYKLGYKPQNEVTESEMILVLPLASPDVTEIVLNDLNNAEAFAVKVNRLYPNGFGPGGIVPGYYTLGDVQYWFFNELHGDYIGRPDNANNPTVWYYNQVNDANMRGAILTWFGIPTRLSDLSYFLAGYTLTRINAPGFIEWIAQYWAGGYNYNDQATQLALLAGIDLANGLINYEQVSTYVWSMYDKTLDHKNITLWPNYFKPDNYVGSYPEVPDEFNPNILFASPCYTNPDFEVKSIQSFPVNNLSENDFMPFLQVN